MVLTGEEFRNADTLLRRERLDDEDSADLIAKQLRLKPHVTKIIVIDEIDSFESHEKAFVTLVKAILTSKTNTILIGIANSVDLPFKKKNSGIAMRDTQLLFEPYNEEQIIEIMEKKTNFKFTTLPESIKKNDLVRDLFFDLLEERAKHLIA